MHAYEHHTRHITDEEGPSIGAFFDFDGTLIAGHSIKDIFVERLLAGELGVDEALDLVGMGLRYAIKAGDFERTMADSIRNMRGTSARAFAELCRRVTEKRLLPAVFPEVRAMVRAHRARGHTVAIVTSATPWQVRPLAERLGIGHVLATELAEQDGFFNGEIDGAPCYGRGKVTATRAFARQRRVAMKRSYFYSNGSEDIPLLEAVGHPVAINPDRRLAAHAAERGWPVHRLESRGSTGVKDIARTVLTFGSVLPLLAAGLPFRWLGVPERELTNLSISTWAGLASLIAGLRLIVHGEQHLWSHRPAVFLFNHQSAMDVLITARLLREDIVGIAKKEIRRQPLMGPALSAAGTVFIDREAGGDPKTVLRPAVDALAAGRSVVIAPEGTRSRDGRLGAFKKGGFHLAMQAGVPIVPIVIHNALDALPGNALVVRPAEVEVTVLEPVETAGWNLRDLARATRDVRRAYLRTLGEDEAPKPSAGER